MSTPALSHDPLWPRASNWPGLADLPADAVVDLAVLGVPAWRTSLTPTNARTTPTAIRSALQRYSPALMPDTAAGAAHEVDLGRRDVVDLGDIDEPDGPDGEARTRAAVAAASARSKLTLALGGDNSATVATAVGAWGDDLPTAGLVTLDAHYDLRDGISNGSPVRRLIEAGLDPTRIVQIGIADFANSAVYAARARELGITVVHRDALHGRAPTAVMAEALAIAGAAGGPVHLDVDVDVCDRAIAPACPASVPGGISAWELRAFVRSATADARVRSADIVEIDATTDAADQRTVRLAALCVLEALAGVAGRA